MNSQDHVAAPEPRVGQRWRDDIGYLYDIVAIDPVIPGQLRYAYGRHPNKKTPGASPILWAWFSQPGWELVRDAA